MIEQLTISRDIAASPGEAYGAISDVTRMGGWSEECDACEWQEGFDSPQVGATFDGHHRHGDHAWATQGKIIDADPGHSFAIECSMHGYHFSTRGYRIEPTPTGCPITGWSDDLRPQTAYESGKQVPGVDDRAVRNHRTMTGVRIAALVRTATWQRSPGWPVMGAGDRTRCPLP